jgi:mono/diheme cytochrome c family protein
MLKRAWGRRVVGALAGVVVGVAGLGLARFHANSSRAHAIAPATLPLQSSPQRIERGRHLTLGWAGCAECHGPKLAGRLMSEDALMRVAAPNLTRGAGSVVQGYADRDWSRTLLHGVGRDGHNLLIMPARELRKFSDDDVASIVSYVRSLPPVDNQLEPSRVKPLGRVLLGLAGAELWSANLIAHAEPRAVSQTPSGATTEQGRYVLGMCRGCHGDNLKGGKKLGPDAPPSADISPSGMASWSATDFERLLRQGKRRDGSDVNPAMPWPAFRSVSDEELRGLWLALRQ